jgi:hypothetical protein
MLLKKFKYSSQKKKLILLINLFITLSAQPSGTKKLRTTSFS